MAEKIVQPLRVPRLVTGLMPRAREVEAVAVWDAVPVALRRVGKDEAPVAFRRIRNGAKTPCRAYDGAAYAPIGRGLGGPAAAWEAMLEQVVPQLSDELRIGGAAARSPYAALLGWGSALAGASRKRGFFEGSDGFREIRDDGTARRDRDLARLAARMLVVGDDLWFRVEAPRIWVCPFHRLIESVERANLLGWDQDDRFGLTWNAGCFRIDRREEAEDFAARLGRTLGLESARGDREVLEVADADALDGIYRALGSDEALGLQAVAGSLGIALKHDLGTMPEEEILRYADLLRLLRAGTAEEVHAWMEGNLAPLRAALATARPLPDGASERVAAGEGPLAQVDMAILRHREFEAPRRHLAAGDEAALLAL